MAETQRHNLLLLAVAVGAVLLPVGMLCFLLTAPLAERDILMIAGFPAVYLAAAPYIPFCLLLWRLSCCETACDGNTTLEIEKPESDRCTQTTPDYCKRPLRLMLGLSGAAGIVAPVMLCQAQAYGLSGLWQLVWCGTLLWCCVLTERDRVSAVLASASAVLGMPCMVYSFILAVGRAAL